MKTPAVRARRLTVAGVLAIVAGLGSLTGAVAERTVSRTCYPTQRGGGRVCVTTGPGVGQRGVGR